jgi:hypothetical protein
MRKYIFLFSTIIAMTLTSCSSNDPEIINEEELITTLRVTLTPQGGGTAVTLQLQDLDGDGPNTPVTTVSGPLLANKTYTGVTQVLNEAVSPTEDITLEVKEEGDEHQFFYTFSNSNATATYTDQDKNNRPIGITFNLTTTNVGIVAMTVTLRHEPNKTAVGVSTGNITNAGGETDVQATFNLTVN